jgi:hypothetical protein
VADWDEDDDDPADVPCPYCRRTITEDHERCPFCGNYITAEDRPAEPKTWFWGVMMLLALAAAAFWVFAG